MGNFVERRQHGQRTSRSDIQQLVNHLSVLLGRSGAGIGSLRAVRDSRSGWDITEQVDSIGGTRSLTRHPLYRDESLGARDLAWFLRGMVMTLEYLHRPVQRRGQSREPQQQLPLPAANSNGVEKPH